MNSEQTPRIAPDLIWRLLDDDAVVVSPRVGKVRVLNGVATVIWKLLAEKKSVDEIETHLVAHYSVSLEQARQDLESFLSDLGERELVTWEA